MSLKAMMEEENVTKFWGFFSFKFGNFKLVLMQKDFNKFLDAFFVKLKKLLSNLCKKKILENSITVIFIFKDSNLLIFHYFNNIYISFDNAIGKFYIT